jgi:zinc protease
VHRNRSRLLAALALSSLSLGASAVPAARADAGALDDFVAGVRRTVLPNGLTLLVRERPGTGVVAIDTWVKAGYFHEPDDKAGMAHLFEHMFFKGSAKFPGPETIARELAQVGGDSNAGTIYDSTNYYFVVPDEGFARAVEILADAVANPLFDADELAKEAEVVIEESNRKLDNPVPLSLERMLAVSFTEHRIRRWRIGSNEVLRGIRRDDLLAFFRTLYRPENMIVAVAGDVSAAEAETVVAREFGALPRGELVKQRGPAEPPQTGFRFGRSTGDLRQGYSVLGWHTQGVGGEDEQRLDLAAAILGGGRSSRLFRHAVGPDAAATATASHWQFEDVGAFIVQASFDEEKRAEVDRRLIAEVERLKAHGPTPYELELARNALRAQLLLGIESALGQVQTLAQAEARYGYAALAEQVRRLGRITPDEVRDAARRYLTVDRLTLYHYAPAGAPELDRAAALAAVRAAAAAVPGAESAPPLPATGAALARAAADRPAVTTTLDNGATLIVRERPGAPTVSVGVHVRGGRTEESSADAGITQLAVSAISRGAAGRSGEELDRGFEFLGTALASEVLPDSFGVSIDLPAASLPPALDLLADVVLRPDFPADGVLEERALQLAAVRRAFDSSVQRPLQLAGLDLWPTHPYGLPAAGTEDSLAALDAARVAAWWRDHLAAEDTVIVVVGDVAAGDARARIERAFGALPRRGSARPAVRAPLPPPTRTDKIEYRDRRQSAIVAAFPGPPPGDPEAARLELLENLTSGLAGTLFAELRGRRSLAYTVFAGYRERAAAGLVFAYLATDAAKEAEARDALLTELRRLGTDGFGEADLARAKSALAGSVRIELETNGALRAELAANALLGLGADATERKLAIARATTLDELRATAARWFGAERFALAILRGRPAG